VLSFDDTIFHFCIYALYISSQSVEVGA